MEIVCILGSPKSKGNSSTIAKRFCDTAEGRGANISYFNLNELNFKGCRGCMACKTKLEECVQKDDLTAVLDAIYKADVVVLTSPVYFGMISGQLKCLIDRMYSFYKPDYITNPSPSRLPAGKKGVFIITQGSSKEDMFDDIHPRIDGILHRQGFKECRTIRCCGLSPLKDSMIPDEIMKLAERTAEEIVV